MTWPSKVAPWIIAVASAALAVGVLVWSLNRGRHLSGELARTKEEAELLAKGIRVAHEATKAQLAEEIARSTALAGQVAALLAASPGASPIATAHGSTGGFTVGSPVVVAPVPGSHPPADPSGTTSPPPGVVSPPPRTCLVEQGDLMEIEVNGAALKTVAGNVVVTATARLNWINRATGETITLMDAVPLNLDVGVLKQPDLPGWGAGLALFAGRWGWAAGPVLAAPPLRVLGIQLEPLIGVGLGPNGDWSAAAFGVFRW